MLGITPCTERAVRPKGRPRVESVSQPEILDELPVLLDVLALDVVQKPTPPSDHLQKALTGMVVVPMGVEVVSKIVDASRKDRDLDRRASTIGLVALVLLDQFFFGDRHRSCLLESHSLQGKRKRQGAVCAHRLSALKVRQSMDLRLPGGEVSVLAVQHRPGVIHVLPNLLHQRVHRRERLDLSKALHEVHPDLFAVDVGVEIHEVQLDGGR